MHVGGSNRESVCDHEDRLLFRILRSKRSQMCLNLRRAFQKGGGAGRKYIKQRGGGGGKPTQRIEHCFSLKHKLHISKQICFTSLLLLARVGQYIQMRLNCPGNKSESESRSAVSNSLPAKPQGKPKNTGVGSLSLLQQIFLTQECNQGLLHHRRILYQLSYQGNHGEQTKTRKTQNFCFLRLQILLKANTVCLNLKYLLIINNLRKSLKSF